MPGEDFLGVARRHHCSTYQLRRTLRQHAIRKDGSRHNNNDSNLLFPPSGIEKAMSSDFVAQILKCPCKICDPLESEPFNDEQLNTEIRSRSGTRLVLAILVYMGTGFAMGPLYSHGLGRDNDLNVVEAFANNASLKSSLFGHLPALLGSRPVRSIDELAMDFCERFAETKQLFHPPSFQDGEIFWKIPSNSNLPFLDETELRNRPSSYARLYKFKIHPEFCSPELSQMVLIRKELRVAEIDANRERNVLEFLRQKHPNLIRLHFAYRHEDNSNLVFAYYPMDLRHVLRERKQPEQPQKVQLSQKLKDSILNTWLWENLKGVVDALPHVHDPSNDTIGAHFDLKPANILVDASGNLVLTDFGLTRIKERTRDGQTSLTNPGGDSNYRPPHLPSEAHWNRKYDIWSLACIMIEVIIYLRDGPDAVNKFAEDLGNDDNLETRSQTFWKQDQGQYILKKPVKILLEQMKYSRDSYLKQVETLLRKMLSIDPVFRPTMTEVCAALFAQNPVATLTSKTDGKIQICGGNTQRPLKKMKISVQSDERGLNNACFLDYWWNEKTSAVSLHMNYTRDGETFNDTSSGPHKTEEFVPLSIYKHPDIIEKRMSCAFRDLHSDCNLLFSQSKDFYHFQAATTRQAVLSHEITSQCSLTLRRRGLHIRDTTLPFSGSGQIQIWRQIRNNEYRRDFVDDVVSIETERLTQKRHESMSNTRPQWLETVQKSSLDVGSDSSDAYGSSSPNGTSIGEDEYEKDLRRLVIFLPKESCRYLTVPLSQGKAVLSESQQEPNRITFERRDNQPYFDVGLFGDFGTHSYHKSGSQSQDTSQSQDLSQPGIPLDPLNIENREEVRATRLEVEFPTPGARDNFLRLYHQIFPHQRRR